ncbi:MAG: TraM recognition domain-containing protein [Isosphaeraceae bacterium]
MRKRLARTRDTLDPASLPYAPATGLCHRTSINSTLSDLLMTLVTLGWQVGLSIALVVPTKFLAFIPLPGIGALFAPILAWHLMSAAATFLKSQPLAKALNCIAIFMLIWALFWLLSFDLDDRQTYLLVFGPAVLAAAVMSHFIAKQFAYWMSVNIRLEQEVVSRWQGYWGYIWSPATPDDCPEIESYRVGFVCLALAYVAGFCTLISLEQSSLAPYAGLLSLVSFVLAMLLLWALWTVAPFTNPMSPTRVLSVAWQGLVTFHRYNSHQTSAPGVFQFPTVFLRRMRLRYLTSIAPIFLFTVSIWQVEAPHFGDFLSETAGDVKHGMSILEYKDDDEIVPSSTPAERAWHDRLPERLRADYRRTVWRRHRFDGTAEFLPGWSVVVVGRTLMLLAIVGFGPVVLFIVVFATTTGRLLAAYHEALEAPDACEVKPDAWPWDNRVHRLLNSSNLLEREHVYLGRSVYGDYPVLLHLSLLKQHAHILGDTGSRKTSIGIAPLLTQLVARADSSVVVLDLKGDMSLFECAREEARRAGLPFKYFTNMNNRASHVFNPLRQSHTDSLTIQQRSQAILQSLSLEYGEGYGEGFFSAVNEIVLKEYLNHYRAIDSFRKLHEYVRVSHAYKALGGVHDDWKNARHLTISLDKLAAVSPLNLTRDNFSDRPSVWDERIDMPGVLKEKQVIYFFLSSAIEPTTVSPVARLAMFNLLTAAAQREGRGHPVYVFIDEFQRIVTENVRLFLEQARSMQLHFILANQTMGQLRRRGLDLVDTVESCTAYKHLFKATDLETLLRLEKASGEALYHENQWDLFAEDGFDTRADADYRDDDSRDIQTREGQGPRLERNTLIELSAASWLSLVRFTEGSGYTQYSGYLTPIVHEFHITEDQFKARSQEPWPDADGRSTVLSETATGLTSGTPTGPDEPAAGGQTRSIIDRIENVSSAATTGPTQEKNHESAPDESA